jgi:hypothetical protein
MTIKSALFVDFDNIFSRLGEIDQTVAQDFAMGPMAWINWLETHLEGGPRRILIRRCYLNPAVFYEYRPYFIRSAFDVIECPALTRQGKTSADIRMAMDVLDVLHHPVPYDEVIFMSGDADFTPLLIRLREHDFQTSVLSVGFTSPAYKAAGSRLIEEETFVRQALGYSENVEPVPTPACDPETHAPPRVVSAAEPAPQQPDDLETTKQAIAAHVKERVARSQFPVSMATLAQEVIDRFDDPTCSDWYGYGRFTDLLRELDITPFEIVSIGPGYVLDPERHDRPTGMRVAGEFEERYPEVAPFARKVHQITDAPYLLPEHYQALFRAIADEINESGYTLTRTSRRVRNQLQEEGVPVSRAHVNFLLVGIGRTGHRFEQGAEDQNILAKAMAKNIYDLCQAAQFQLDKHETELLFRWLVPRMAQEA